MLKPEVAKLLTHGRYVDNLLETLDGISIEVNSINWTTMVDTI